MDDVGPSGRLRQAAAILVFDLGGPLLAYAPPYTLIRCPAR